MKSSQPTANLHSSVYTDMKFLTRELGEIFENAWQYGCRTGSIARSGNYKTLVFSTEAVFPVCENEGEKRGIFSMGDHPALRLLSGTRCAKEFPITDNAHYGSASGRYSVKQAYRVWCSHHFVDLMVSRENQSANSAAGLPL